MKKFNSWQVVLTGVLIIIAYKFIDNISYFLDALGSGYREDTLRLCDDTAARLQSRLEKAEKEYPSRIKLYTAMPLLIAVSVIVLIL